MATTMMITAEDWVGAHSMMIWICAAATYTGWIAPNAFIPRTLLCEKVITCYNVV